MPKKVRHTPGAREIGADSHVSAPSNGPDSDAALMDNQRLDSREIEAEQHLDRVLFAAQLGAGVASLKFAPAIEAEFRDAWYQRNLGRMRVGFALAIALYLVFLTVRLITESGPGASASMVVRAMIIAAMTIAILLSYRLSRQAMTRVLMVTYWLFAAGVTVIECIANHYGVDRRYEGLIFISVHCFVFSGLLFRTALLTAAAIFMTYAYGGWLGGLSGAEWGYELFFIGLIDILGAVSLYTYESTERENFLRRHMLGDLANGGLVASRLTANRVQNSPSAQRRVLTLMLTDTVASTQKLEAMGDKAWQNLTARADKAIRDALSQYGGGEIDSTGDGLLAVFESPGLALHGARAVREACARLGLDLRIGIHSGEVELDEASVRGFAVHLAARIAALGSAGEILVSRTLRDVVRGADWEFAEHGSHQLRGINGEWEVYRLL